MVESWMYDHGAVDGWWMGPYSSGGDSHEGILRNTGGLKGIIAMLGEARGSGGVTRPAEGTQLANHNRKVYARVGCANSIASAAAVVLAWSSPSRR
jgi:hypothetical protein